MSRGREATEVEGPVVKWAQAHKWLTLKVNGLGKKGFPDHFFFGKPRLLVMMEFKVPGEKPAPIQDYIHGWLRALGWPVYVVTSKEQGIDILKRERGEALDPKASPGEGAGSDDAAGGSRPPDGPGAG